MKLLKGTLLALFLVSLLPAFASAQTLPQFSHIIIIVQENRTPDNIFGAYGALTPTCVPGEHPFEPGVDIENGGYTKNSSGRSVICDVSQPMNEPSSNFLDPGHQNEDWTADHDNGGMDGFCHQFPNGACPAYPQATPYSFVQRSDVQPYYDIATNYGFANYMFQTNEGPSFEAHQFLFTGTSAPVAPGDPNNYYLDFVADNPPYPAGFSYSGCPATGADGYPQWILPNQELEADPRQSECYPHDSLVTDSGGDKGVSWRYYTPTVSNTSNPLGIIWDAPEAIPEVCYGTNNGGTGNCNSTEFTQNVIYPGDTVNGFTYSGAPILDDIQKCNLQKISWVIPDEAWSDHPFMSTSPIDPPYGPSWVGNIVNAVGNSWTQGPNGGKCDYWGTNSTTPEPTAILIVWDDWGGWFDHVPPPDVYTSASPTECLTTDAPNGWGCGYVYGFRVPFMVVSEYTQAGYVSGALPTPGQTFPYVHDFGSILAFIENNFGLPNVDQSAHKGYADLNAPDNQKSNVPLSDFFKTSNRRTFTQIPVHYPPDKFQGYYATPQNGVYPTPTGPDAVPGEDD